MQDRAPVWIRGVGFEILENAILNLSVASEDSAVSVATGATEHRNWQEGPQEEARQQEQGERHPE
jgi:hypothetical protein